MSTKDTYRNVLSSLSKTAQTWKPPSYHQEQTEYVVMYSCGKTLPHNGKELAIAQATVWMDLTYIMWGEDTRLERVLCNST